MTPEEFLNSFGMLAEAPEGINRVRELVLELATRGMLVPQSADDEAAAIALRKRHETRRYLWKERHGTKPFPSSPSIPVAELPSLPPGWAWEKIEYLGQDPFAAVQTGPFGSQLLKTEFVSTGVPVIAVGNIGYLSFKNDGRFFITAKKAEALSRYNIQAGDLLFARTGSVGKVCVAPDYVAGWRMTGHILRLRLDTTVANPRFIAFTLRGSASVQQQVSEGIKGTTRPGFNTSLLERVIVPIPPLAEQKRIVAKVDQLMALCDELEARQTKQRETGARLTQSALEALTSAEGPEEFDRAWQRVADNFEVLFTTPKSIGELRKSVLGLALHGRLVHQDASEEDASTLLERIAQGHLQPSQRSDAATADEETRHPLPVTWTWASVGSIATCMLGKMLDKSKHTRGTPRPYLRNINVRWSSFDLSDLLSMYFEDDELERYGVRAGDVLICEGGEPGRAAVWRDSSKTMLIQKAIHRARLEGGIVPEWLVMNLRYDAWTGQLAQHFTGATIKHFTGQALARYQIRLAPLAEQKRIIAKVDQLLALCDTLESKLRDAEQGAQRLAEAMVAEMVA